MKPARWFVFVILLLSLPACSRPLPPYEHGLTASDIEFLQSFTLDALPALPQEPSNRYADDPAAASLGHRIFFDPGFSANGEVSCASCHQPDRFFTDGLARGQGMGTTVRNTISLLGAAWGPWKYWDGRKDSLWSQALEPLEHSEEHGFSRQLVLQRVQAEYRNDYQAVFGSVESHPADTATAVFVNVGKALMAYQRRLQPPQARFDKLVAALNEGDKAALAARFTSQELAGMRLFMGKAACASCHNGPLFSNFEFHNIGAPEANQTAVDLGRYQAIERLNADEFNCLSRWSDASAQHCEELAYLKQQGPELVGAFKTPSLRNVAATAPYMHAGQLATLQDVINHYSEPSPPFYDRQQHPSRPHFDILPLRLSDSEKQELLAFLLMLSASLPDDLWWQPPAL